MVLLEGGAPALDRFDAFRYRKELRRLERKKNAMESLLFVVAGRDLRRAGVLALTNRRILWVTSGLRRTREFSLVSVVGLRAGIDGTQGVVTIESPELKLAIARIAADEATGFVQATRVAAAEAGNNALRTLRHDPRPVDEPLLSLDAAEEKLARLDRMRDQGSMTQMEYVAGRRRILEQSEGHPDPPKGSWWRRF